MLAEGTILNHRYRLLRMFSNKGGMGLIYQAADQNFDDDPVIIKQSRFADEYLQKAFEREARLLRRLHHESLPRAIDYFFIPQVGQFFVMDFIPGHDLGYLLNERLQQNQGPYPPDQVLAWADQLLGALEYIHSQDTPIIHRDIKPDNIKLRPDGRVVLLDFGLAKGAPSGMSVVASIPGHTPLYAPLEQMHGKGTDARSDLYSLAVTLQHLLTGKLPVDAVARVSDTITGATDPLRPAHELNPQIPRALSDVLQKAASLNQNDRPPTAAAMREALRQAAQQPDTQPARAPVTARAAARPQPARLASPSPAVFHMAEPAPPLKPQLRISLPKPGAPPVVVTPSGGARWKLAASLITLALLIGLAVMLSREQEDSVPEPVRPAAVRTPVTIAPGSVTQFAEDLGKGVRLEMVSLPGATFTMGAEEGQPDEKPLHQVTLAPFAIGKYEVTQAQYQAVMGALPEVGFKGGNRPVEKVSWTEAMEFCQKLSQKTGRTYRLPTEAEWEFACNAGKDGKYHFGDEPDRLAQYAWYDKNSGNQTQPVGQKKPNGFGLYDLHGNVWEWCLDWYDKDFYARSPGQNPQQAATGTQRVVRGGSWTSSAVYCRSTLRGVNAPDDRSDYYGFRVVSVTSPQ